MLKYQCSLRVSSFWLCILIGGSIILIPISSYIILDLHRIPKLETKHVLLSRRAASCQRTSTVRLSRFCGSTLDESTVTIHFGRWSTPNSGQILLTVVPCMNKTKQAYRCSFDSLVFDSPFITSTTHQSYSHYEHQPVGLWPKSSWCHYCTQACMKINTIYIFTHILAIYICIHN